MVKVLPYRELAGKTLEQAADTLNSAPNDVLPQLASAHFARAQAIATIAVAQALLEIGDVLRDRLNRPELSVTVAD